MTVPYIFQNRTSPIPLAELDADLLAASGILTGWTFVRSTQTALPSQTIFVGIPLYITGTNSLIVYVNGLLAQNSDYTETNTTTVTFAAPFVGGEQVAFFSGSLVSSYAVSANGVTFTQVGSGAVSRMVQGKLEESVSIFDFMTSAQISDAKAGTASIDIRAAFAAAVLAARGKKLFFPEGQYLLNTDGGTITLEEICIDGEMVLDGSAGAIDQGSVIRVVGTTNSPFKVRRGTTFNGLGIYYPNQTDSAAPTAYPVTFDFDYSNGAVQFVYITNNVIYNAYKFIDMSDTGGNVGHIWIENNSICVLNRGIWIRRNLEHIRIYANDFTFGIWQDATDEAKARKYIRDNCTYIKIDESDGLDVFDNLMFGSLNGVLAAASALTQLQIYSRNSFDNVRYPIKATGAGNWDGTILENVFNSINGNHTTLQARSIEISTTGVGRENITIGPNAWKQSTEDHIYVTGNNPTRDITVTGGNFLSWAAFKAGGTYGALNINGSLTSLMITGSKVNGINNTAHSNGLIGTFNVLTCNGVNFEGCTAALSVTVGYANGAGNVSYATGGATSDIVGATVLQWGPNAFDKPNAKTVIQYNMTALSNNASYVNDGAAQAGGIPVGGMYRNGSALMVRVA